jgi:hypothetical protein
MRGCRCAEAGRICTKYCACNDKKCENQAHHLMDEDSDTDSDLMEMLLKMNE